MRNLSLGVALISEGEGFFITNLALPPFALQNPWSSNIGRDIYCGKGAHPGRVVSGDRKSPTLGVIFLNDRDKTVHGWKTLKSKPLIVLEDYQIGLGHIARASLEGGLIFHGTVEGNRKGLVLHPKRDAECVRAKINHCLRAPHPPNADDKID